MLVPYFDMIWAVVTRMQVVIDPHLVSIYPKNLPEAVAAMINPVSVNFKHMTPSYLYIILLGYLIFRWVKKTWGFHEVCLLALGIYGFIMYNTGFRGLWASQFEMALMPEKLIYFFLIETGILWLYSRMAFKVNWQKSAFYILVIFLFLASWGYAINRYNHRFWAFKYVSFLLGNKKYEKEIERRDKNETYAQLTIDRARGIWVPVDQEKELRQLEDFIKQKTKPEDKIVMFPELGMYNFLFDRPFVGRFPITTFSWFNDHWFEEYMGQLRQKTAKYIIVQKKMSPDWYQVYLGYPPNKEKYDQILELIHKYYKPIAQTGATEIYLIKNEK
jgi:hypothetical protein